MLHRLGKIFGIHLSSKAEFYLLVLKGVLGAALLYIYFFFGIFLLEGIAGWLTW